MLTHDAKKCYVYKRRQNLCRCQLLEQIYVTKYIEICLISSASLNLYSEGTSFSSQQIHRLQRLRYFVVLVSISVRMLQHGLAFYRGWCKNCNRKYYGQNWVRVCSQDGNLGCPGCDGLKATH